MVKRLLLMAALFLSLVVFSTNSAFAFVEKGDTLIITNEDAAAKPWNEIIAGDTLADGSRQHLVYELVPDGWYPLSATLTAGNSDLNIVGGKRSKGQSRPVILVAEPFGGWWMISASQNLTMKGVHFMQCANTLGGNIGPWARSGVVINDTNRTVILEDNIWDFNTAWAVLAKKNGLKLFVSNCLFRFNLPTTNGTWAGQGLDIRQARLDTVIIQNCTWYGGGPFMLCLWESSENLFRMDHCTLADWAQFPIHGIHWTHAEFTNNLFYNAHTMGEDSAQVRGQDTDFLPYGVLDIDTLRSDMVGEASRIMEVKNNNNYVSPNIKTYWNEAMSDPAKYHYFAVADPTYHDGFMNSRTRAMFENDADWPGLVQENTTSLDPQFENFFDYSDTLVNFSKYIYIYAWPDAKPTTFMKDPDGEPLQPTDPMVYNLKITNSALRTASTSGGVIGDQTWELANGYNSTQAEIQTTDVKKGSAIQPDKFVLFQNYPNPFNPSTKINFNLSTPSRVHLTVFNALGQKVATLVDRRLASGFYSYEFNGSKLSSGIYIYRLETEIFTTQKKMIMIK